MLWISAALVAVVFNSLKNVFTRLVGDTIDSYTTALVSNLLMLPVLWIGVVVSGVFSVSPEFWWTIALMLPFEVLVTVLFYHALTSSELSYSFPFVSFMPLFVAIGSYFILDETHNWFVYLGLLILVAGAFLMNSKRETLHANLRGALYILLVAALWGYIIPMGSLAVSYSSAQLFPAIYFTLATVLFVPLFLVHRRTPLGMLPGSLPMFVLIGVCYALFTLANWYAYSLGPATVVSALAMLSVLGTSLFSGALLRERLSAHRLVGAICLTIGAIVVTLG